MAPNAAAPAAAAAETPSAGKTRRAQRARPLDATGMPGPSDPTAFGPNPEAWRAWTCEEVCSWVKETLRREGIPDAAAIVAAFRSQAVTGAHLDMLSPALLQEELAFGALGPRLSFLRARDALIAPGDSEGAGGSPATGSENGELKALRHSVYELGLRVQRLEAATKEVANSPSRPDSALSGEREGTDCLSKEVEDTVEDVHAPLRASDCLKKGIKDTVGTGIKVKHGTAQNQETHERHKPPRSEEGEGGGGTEGKRSGRGFRWTHFVALPVQNESLVANLKHVQQQVLAAAPGLRPGRIPACKLHVSLAIVRCEDSAAEARARAALRACAPALAALFPPGGIAGAHFRVAGVGHFRNGVLWAGVQAVGDPGSDLLQSMACVIQRALLEAGTGVHVQGDGADAEKLQGHVTLLKTSFFSGSQRRALGQAERDFGSLCAPWRDSCFGLIRWPLRLRALLLCAGNRHCLMSISYLP